MILPISSLCIKFYMYREICVPSYYLLLRLVVSVCSFVRPCVRVKNGNGSRMRALPDAPSTCDQFTVTGQSTTCLYVKCEKMLALSSDYKT